MRKQHIGSNLDGFLWEGKTFEEAQALAIKEVVVWQLTDAIEKQSPSKARLALRLKTSRSQVDRLLDPVCSVPPPWSAVRCRSNGNYAMTLEPALTGSTCWMRSRTAGTAGERASR